MEKKYAKNEILAAGIALAILVFSANVVIPAIGAVLLVAAKKTATIMVAAAVCATAGGVVVAGGATILNNAEKLATYTGVAAGVFAIAGLILITTGVGFA